MNADEFSPAPNLLVQKHGLNLIHNEIPVAESGPNLVAPPLERELSIKTPRLSDAAMSNPFRGFGINE
jgi:hypothetical protein